MTGAMWVVIMLVIALSAISTGLFMSMYQTRQLRKEKTKHETVQPGDRIHGTILGIRYGSEHQVPLVFYEDGEDRSRCAFNMYNPTEPSIPCFGSVEQRYPGAIFFYDGPFHQIRFTTRTELIDQAGKLFMINHGQAFQVTTQTLVPTPKVDEKRKDRIATASTIRNLQTQLEEKDKKLQEAQSKLTDSQKKHGKNGGESRHKKKKKKSA